MDLDGSQRRAAYAPTGGATNVMAGAGTGKTRVLVARYLKLVEEDGVPIDRVLALTFTLKAAGEMRERVRKEIVKRRPHLVRQLRSAWIMNFHQFGFRLIKENAPALGVDPGVDVVSPAEFERIVRRLERRFEDGRVDGVPPDFGGSPPPPTELPTLFDTLKDVFLECRNHMVGASELRRMCRDEEHPAYLARVDTIIALEREYESELERRNLLDFSDMIAVPARGLRADPELAARYRDAFDHILVDEFQDTSEAQYELLRLLSGDDFRRVTVVGDVKQSIYRWRDARVEYIQSFPATKIPLEKNYRSTQGILDLAHDLVVRAPELRDEAPLEAHRGASAHRVVLFHPEGGDPDWKAEAESLATWVEQLLGRAPAPATWGLAPLETALAPGDIAVLLRKLRNSVTRARIEDAFQGRGIPYTIVGGANTTEALSLDAWHALLSLLLPGDRALELLTVLEGEPFHLTEASLCELLAGAPESGCAANRLAESRIARVQDERDASVLRDLRELLVQMEGAWARLGFRSFLAWTIEHSPLRFELLGRGASANAVDELLRELFDVTGVLEERSGLGLAAFLEHLRAALDERKFREEGDVRLPRDRVGIMTIHQAKGLEFPAVAVAGIIPPGTRTESHLLSRATGVWFRGDEAREWGRHAEKAENYLKEKEMNELEERCVLYVAMTRAKDHLWVSSPRADGVKKQEREDKRSFFTDLLEGARARDLAVEIREAPVPPVGPAVAVGTLGADAGAVAAAVRAWSETRRAVEETEAGARSSPGVIEMVTWSALRTFQRCPLALAYDRETGRAASWLDDDGDVGVVASDSPDAASIPRGVDPAAFGTFVHEALRMLSGDAAGEVDAALEALSDRYDFGTKRGAALAEAKALVTSARASLASPNPRVETPFAVRVGNAVIQGVVDRIDETPDGRLVTDWKIGEPSDDHALQVQVYAWAIGRIEGAETQGDVAYLRPGGVHRVRVASPETSREIDALVAGLDGALAAGEFPPTPGRVCASCPHRPACPHAVRDAVAF